eukprot:s4955_g4.t1
MALQQGHPFARHIELSSAVATVRDFGSGDDLCAVQGLHGQSTLLAHSMFIQTFASLPPGAERYGEALHPGPDWGHLLTVGVSNPSGLRQKEHILLGLGPGIWSLAETQLSQSTFKTSSGILRRGARQMNREVRFLGGAPAPLRSGSTWAGSWTGVSVLSDVPAVPLDVIWPPDHWDTGRVLLTRHWANNTPITIGTFYGYAPGPTWPQSRKLSDELLATFTKEVIFGMEGIRILSGDFNKEPGVLHQQQLWMRHGWQNAQQVAQMLFDHEIVATCKGATQPDQIWLSPEAVHLMRGITITEDFMEHLTVAIQLQIPEKEVQVYKWPRPAKIPWTALDLADWDPACEVQFDAGQDSDVFMRQWAHAFEHQVDSVYQHQTGSPLPKRCFGRAHRLHPVLQKQTAAISKTSREGEVRLTNSLAGTAIRAWFKQLRRIQSLKHSVMANKQTPAAITYRAECWMSISHARGFSPDFPTWWANQSHIVDGTPPTWPPTAPTESVLVQAIYDSFHAHFRAFETWHLQQRATSINQKYENSLEAVFSDLRKDPRHGVDHLRNEHFYTILAVDQESRRIHLDQDVQPLSDAVWLHHGQHVIITQAAGDICTVSDPSVFEVGDEVIQRIYVTDTNQILKQFEAHWRPRWNALAEVPEEAWERITQFASHYMECFPFQWKPLSLTDWFSTVKRFKPRAARGPDGFDKDDLGSMPASFAQPFLDLMTAIENGATTWPSQLKFGTVIGLAKQDNSCAVEHFRPITLFPTLYRTWAKLRTKQIIQQMARWIPAEALGFLPRRETSEVWLMVQAQIEVMLQYDLDFSGLSTDLKKAFNHIGRRQTFMIAARLGLPPPLLHAWSSFLDNFVRRFDVAGCLGPEITSNSGYPEGCPLSIISMLTVNWSYHVYMRVFCPRVQAYSFVDNLTLAAREAMAVIQAFFALKTICQLFGLTTDDGKTFVWGLTKTSKACLSQLGFDCYTDASELGGAMTYTRARRNRVLRQRGDQLKPRWQKLKQSRAPLPQKMCMLSRVFWPQALHGSSNCLISDNYALELRRAATKAMGTSGAGSNPLLRLSLSDNMTNDPGFFQLQLSISTLRRLMRKSPDLLMWWQIWMDGFSGKLLPGPFSRLMHCLSGIGWSITQPPWVCDHDGLCWNLISMDSKTLRSRLEDAWMQFVASQTKHKTMKDLAGLSGEITMQGVKTMLPPDRARLAALHSGSFMTNFEKAKFDHEKMPMCTICHTEDDRAHWLQCPRFQHLRRRIPGWLPDNVELPSCVVHHLLVPRIELLVNWRKMLYDVQDCTGKFCVQPPVCGFQHVFIDGTCTMEPHMALQLASWGVVSASCGMVVATGHLSGLTQSIDRAELTALLAALRWGEFSDMDMCIWSDSQSTVHLAEFIQTFDHIPDGVENYDLWLQVQLALQNRLGRSTWLRWIPSHLDPDCAIDSFEDWVIFWNAQVDQLVAHTNANRPDDLLHHQHRTRQVLDAWSLRIQQLRQFFFAVADLSADETCPVQEEVQTISSDEDDEDWRWVPWEDHLPVNWQVRLQHGDFPVPGLFLISIVNWLCASERLPGRLRVLSDLQLVFALTLDSAFRFPFQVDGSLSSSLRAPDSLFQRPTVGSMLKSVQHAMKCIDSMFPHLPFRTQPLPSHDCGVFVKYHGIRFHCPDMVWHEMQTRLKRFTANRPVKRASDLARPLP